jgi:hypothetical protein
MATTTTSMLASTVWFYEGKRVLPAEETHSAEPEFVSLSDKGQEIEDKDNDQESEAQDPTTTEANAQPPDDRGQEHQKGVQRQIQRTLQGQKRKQTQKCKPRKLHHPEERQAHEQIEGK